MWPSETELLESNWVKLFQIYEFSGATERARMGSLSTDTGYGEHVTVTAEYDICNFLASSFTIYKKPLELSELLHFANISSLKLLYTVLRKNTVTKGMDLF